MDRNNNVIELTGRYGNAKVFADIIEEEAISQIITLLNQPFTENSKIRIMPDVHAGKGCTIGFTANLGDKIIPNLVGVDIGCGILCVPLGKVDIDFKKLDKIIRDLIPYGFEINKSIYRSPYIKQNLWADLRNMYCYKDVIGSDSRLEKVLTYIPSLGGGNHFIEVDKDEFDNKYLLIHTGSRHLGLDVCKYYQRLAEKTYITPDINSLIEDLKRQGKESEIEASIKEFKKINPTIPKDLRYLSGRYRDEYIHDMKIVQRFAFFNRYFIAEKIIENLFANCKVQMSIAGKIKIKLKGIIDTNEQWFDTIHNYIGDDNIIRKGAISATLNEKVCIPINMRDGCIIGYGKGNEDYNNSAPHGAGRIMSRSKAKSELDLSEYANSMNGIYSTCINESTLDECPQAYKGIDSIINNIEPTVNIDTIIKPIYNFKAGN